MQENLDTGSTTEQNIHKITKKQMPFKHHKVAISDSTIGSTILTDNDEITKIAEDLSLTNPEKIELLQELLAAKQLKAKSLSQPAAKHRCIDAINTARQYISMLKEGTGDMNDDDEEMDVFDMIYHNATQVAMKISNALIVTGDAGMGKTHEILEAVKFLNPKPKEIPEDIIEEDEDENTEEDVIEEPETINENEDKDIPGDTFTIIRKKAPPKKKEKKNKPAPTVSTASSLNTLESGYFIASGTCTAAYLYELLFIYRKRTLIFNDLDSILEDDDCIKLLLAALDTYPIRELTKMTKGNSFNSLGMSDQEMWDEYEITQKVPNQFKFSGSIIFISNIHEDKFNKALISRSLHVEVRLSKRQILERMHKLICGIRPHVSLSDKLEALEHLEFLTSNYICKFNLNLRELIHAIDYKTTHGDKTIKLGNKELLLWKQLLRGRIVKSKMKY